MRGVSFEYPASFTVTEESPVSTLIDSGNGYFRVMVTDNPRELDAEGLKDEFHKNDKYGYSYEESFVMVAGIRAYKQGRHDLGVIENYLIPRGKETIGFRFEFNAYPLRESFQKSKIALINQIMSSVRFSR